MSLGKLEKVDLRTEWRNEATDFTKWLAQEDNLALLSEEIGIDIKLIQTEASVGSFHVDILAEDESSGRKIIIENQLEITDHDHLGKIITYASGHDANIIIWIVRNVRDEHKQAIDWLNEHTDEHINFFAIKMELWKIDNSSPAPKFHIISKPNDWAKAIKKFTSQSELTETKLLQQKFWEGFNDYAEKTGIRLRLRDPKPRHWYDLAVGSSIAHLTLTLNTQEKSMACELYIPQEKELFRGLLKHSGEIEEEIGELLSWKELPTKKASRIKLSKEMILKDEEKWDLYFEWCKKTAEKFQEVFYKYIPKVNI